MKGMLGGLFMSVRIFRIIWRSHFAWVQLPDPPIPPNSLSELILYYFDEIAKNRPLILFMLTTPLFLPTNLAGKSDLPWCPSWDCDGTAKLIFGARGTPLASALEVGKRLMREVSIAIVYMVQEVEGIKDVWEECVWAEWSLAAELESGTKKGKSSFSGFLRLVVAPMQGPRVSSTPMTLCIILWMYYL